MRVKPLAVVALASCLAQTRDAQLQWRTELEPKLAAGAVGPDHEWTDRNAYEGRVHIWRWPVAPGTGRVYLYVRDLPTCGHGATAQPVLLAQRDQAGGLQVEAGPAGVALDLPPATWFVFVDKEGHEFDVHDGESLLLLVEPWPVPRRDSGEAIDEHDATSYREHRNREVAAQGCRHRHEVGRPWQDVPAWTGATG